MYKLILPPDQSSYSFVDSEENLRQELDGGSGRYRRDIIGASRIVTCQWTVDRNNYQYLRSFYKIITESALPFLIDLYMDSPYLTEHTAHFMPETMRLSGQSGHTFTVTCQIEAEPIDTSEFDFAYVNIVGAYANADTAGLVLYKLSKLVNIDLPLIVSGYVPPNPEPIIPDNVLTDANGNYLVDSSGAYLYGPVYIAPASNNFTDESGNILLDENSNVLVGDFA